MRMGKLAGAVALVSTVASRSRRRRPARACSAAGIAGGVLRSVLTRRRAGVRQRGRRPSLLGRGGDVARAGPLAAARGHARLGRRARRRGTSRPRSRSTSTSSPTGRSARSPTRRSRRRSRCSTTRSAPARAAPRPASASSSPASPAPTTRAGSTRTPAGRTSTTMKQALKQGGDNALNLYSTTAGDYLGWAYLPDITTKPGQRVPRRRRVRLGVDPRHLGHLRGPLRPGRDRHARGRPLAEPRAHVLRRLQPPRATSSTTRRRRRPRRRAARPARTPAPRRAWTRSTTTWTTPTTPATRSSRPARSQRMRDAWLLYRAS